MAGGAIALGFPPRSLTVNAVGSLLMGFLLETLGSGTAVWLLSVGFCGGFTTSPPLGRCGSSLRSGDYGSAVLCVGINLTVCILCILIGAMAGRGLKN